MSFLTSLLGALLGPSTSLPGTPRPKPIPEVANPTIFSTAINLARTGNGRAPLSPHPALNRSASWWAGEMARNSILTHGDAASRIASVLANSASGECIGMGYRSADEVVAAWMADPPHRAIVLGDYGLVGVGEVIDSNGQAWWCADFAKNG